MVRKDGGEELEDLSIVDRDLETVADLLGLAGERKKDPPSA